MYRVRRGQKPVSNAVDCSTAFEVTPRPIEPIDAADQRCCIYGYLVARLMWTGVYLAVHRSIASRMSHPSRSTRVNQLKLYYTFSCRTSSVSLNICLSGSGSIEYQYRRSTTTTVHIFRIARVRYCMSVRVIISFNPDSNRRSDTILSPKIYGCVLEACPQCCIGVS